MANIVNFTDKQFENRLNDNLEELVQVKKRLNRQVVILQLKEIDDETEEYVGVENEFVLETVFALFKERNKDFFTFE